MKNRSCLLAGIFVLFTCSSCALAQWEPVSPGIDYRHFEVAGPNHVFVTRMERNNPDLIIDSCIGEGRISGGLQTTTGMAMKYDDSIGFWGGYWGQRNDVKVAVNGDFFSFATGIPTGSQITSGWYAKRFGKFGGNAGLSWHPDRDLWIGECVNYVDSEQTVRYVRKAKTQAFDNINVPRGADQLIIYTPQYDKTTLTDDSGTEVVVQLDTPLFIRWDPNYVRGYVREIRVNAGSTIIPFDSIVLSASGSEVSTLVNNVLVGDEIRINQKLRHYEADCNTTLSRNWTDTYTNIGRSWYFLKGGVIQTFTNEGALIVNPRTAFAYNNDYIYFVVVDGRSPISFGMNMQQLGEFCLYYLGASEGINQDGGGSSTMVVNHQIKNVPSDGNERAVANGLMMIAVQPKQQSTRFYTGQSIRTLAAPAMRPGPGRNYAVIASTQVNTDGVILAHSLNGVYATVENWWKCQLGSNVGWVPETSIADPTVIRAVPDYDSDNDVDQDDFGHFQTCMSGTNIVQNDPACQDALLDWDYDVDNDDFAVFQNCYTGPLGTVDPNCTN